MQLLKVWMQRFLKWKTGLFLSPIFRCCISAVWKLEIFFRKAEQSNTHKIYYASKTVLTVMTKQKQLKTVFTTVFTMSWM